MCRLITHSLVQSASAFSLYAHRSHKNVVCFYGTWPKWNFEYRQRCGLVVRGLLYHVVTSWQACQTWPQHPQQQSCHYEPVTCVWAAWGMHSWYCVWWSWQLERYLSWLWVHQQQDMLFRDTLPLRHQAGYGGRQYQQQQQVRDQPSNACSGYDCESVAFTRGLLVSVWNIMYSPPGPIPHLLTHFEVLLLFRRATV